jgi:hypothetical protein
MTVTFIELRTLVAADEIDISFTPFGYRPIRVTLADLDILLDEGTADPLELVELDFGDDDGPVPDIYANERGSGCIVAAKAILA